MRGKQPLLVSYSRGARLDGINSKLKNLNKEKTEKLDSLKQEWNKQQQALAAEKKTQAEVIGKEEKEEQRRISSIKTEYEALSWKAP